MAYFNIKLDQLSDLEDNDSVLHHWESPFLHRNLIGATMCSLIVGVVLACLATFCINTGLSYVLRERSLTKRAQMRAIVGLNIKNFQKELDSHTTSRAERDAPFEFIFDLFDSILIDPDPQPKPEFDLSNLVQYWKKKVFKEKAWGLRKIMKIDDFPIQLRHDLLSE